MQRFLEFIKRCRFTKSFYRPRLHRRAETLELRTLLSFVSGTIFDDANGNGRRDFGEPGRSGVVVTLSEFSNSETTTSDDEGRYSFDNASGPVQIGIEPPAGFAQTTRAVTFTPSTFPATALPAEPVSVVSINFDSDPELELIVNRKNPGLIPPAVIEIYDFNPTSKQFVKLPGSADGGLSAGHMIVGDFSGDEKPDIAFAQYLENANSKIGILKNDGNGGFAAPAMFEVNGRPMALAAANLDDTPGLDLVSVSDTGSALTVLLNRTSGPSGALSFTAANVDAPYGISAVAIGDFDTAAGKDIAIVGNDVPIDEFSDFSPSYLTIYSNDGTGSFGADARLDIALDSEFGTDFAITDLSAGNLDGDGIGDDLVIVGVTDKGQGPGNVFLFRNQGGLLESQPSTTANAGTGAFQVELADVDLDGDLDLAVANGDGAQPTFTSLLLNLGDNDSQFTELVPTTISGSPFENAGPYAMTLAELNGAPGIDWAMPSKSTGNHKIGMLTSSLSAGNLFVDRFDGITQLNFGLKPVSDISISLAASESLTITASPEGFVQVSIDNEIEAKYSNIPASAIEIISIFGGDGNNRVDLQGVSIASYPNISSISVDGGKGADTILGSSFSDVLRGGDQNDSLQGGAGNDSLDGGESNDSLTGGDGNDQLTGGAGDDTLTGSAGHDTLQAESGSDLLFDSFNANLTISATQLISNSGGVTETDALNGFEKALILGGGSANVIDASAIGVPVTLFGGGGNDVLIGSTQADALDGQTGNDTLTGLGGADSLVGAAGNDTVKEALDQNLTLTNSTLLASGNSLPNVTDKLATIELADLSGGLSRNKIDLSAFTASLGTTVNGNGQTDTIIGSPGPDIIFTLTGNDSINGLGGADIISAGGGNDTLSGGEGNDNLNGQNGDDSVLGDAGADVIVGGAGIDTLLGGADNDFLSGQTEPGLLSGGGGNDILQGNTANDTLNGDAGDDRLVGLQANDLLTGGDGADTLFGGAGVDTLNGGVGADDLRGEGGNDTIDGGADGDRINEVLDTTVTIMGLNITTVGLGSDTITNVERINVLGGEGSNFIDARLAAVPVLLSGGGGNDTLFGGSKVDIVDGGEGNDVISGGAGSDILEGGVGTDVVYEVANTSFTVVGTTISSTTTGNETAANVEGVVLIGGDLNNTLDASASSVQVTLLGAGGNDTLLGSSHADVLIGGHRSNVNAGTDSLVGGTGADSFDNDDADQRVTEPEDEVLANVFALLPPWIDAI